MQGLLVVLRSKLLWFWTTGPLPGTAVIDRTSGTVGKVGVLLGWTLNCWEHRDLFTVEASETPWTCRLLGYLRLLGPLGLPDAL